MPTSRFKLALAVAVVASSYSPLSTHAADAGLPDAGGGAERAGCGATQNYEGNATFFAFGNGVGSCGIGRNRGDAGVAALSVAEYSKSASCGACVRVSGPRGTVLVRVVDRCVHCKPGDIDLNGSAFDAIATRSDGRVPVTWSYVPCTDPGPLRYHFRRGSSPLRTAVQVRNHRHAVRELEYLDVDGRFVSARRDAYNYFVHRMSTGPYTFRITDVHGARVIERDVRHRPAREVLGTVQFPECQP